MYLAPIISQHLDILHQLECLGIVFSEMEWNQGAMHKEWPYIPYILAHLMSIMVCGLHESVVIRCRELLGYERFAFNLFVPFLSSNMFFPFLYSQLTLQTAYIPSRTKKTMSKVQSEHTQSLHQINIRQFFTCLNCIPSIKFNFAK